MPVKHSYFPDDVRTATAILSLSGSVAKTRSDFVFCATEIPFLSAAGFSGFGESTVLKLGSCLFCSSTTATSTPWSQSAGIADIDPVPLIGVKTSLGALSFNIYGSSTESSSAARYAKSSSVGNVFQFFSSVFKERRGNSSLTEIA